MSVDSSFTQRSFIADLLSKSDSPHRLLESLSHAIASRANTAVPGSRPVIDGQSNSPYVSCLYYNGKPLLPPILTETERIEMASIRERAVLVEKQVAQRKEESRRRLLNYVAQRLEQLDSRNRHEIAERSRMTHAQGNKFGGLFIHEEKPGNEGGDSHHKPVAAANDFANTSVDGFSSSTARVTEGSAVAGYDVTMTSSDVDMTSSLKDSLIQNQTLETSVNKTASPSSYFSPNRLQASRISPRRRLNMDESTDKQYTYKHTASSRAHLKACALSNVKLYAIARGYLTRKLLQCSKVQQLATTIRDLSTFLYNTSPVSARHTHDSVLQDQVKSQLNAARAAVHSVFFVYGPREQMALIRKSRQMEHKRVFRQTPTASEDTPRLSVATRKAIERREKLQSDSIKMLPTSRPAVKAATPTVPSHKVKPTVKSKSAPRREKPASIKPGGKTPRSMMTTVPKQRASSAKSKAWK